MKLRIRPLSWAYSCVWCVFG